VLGKGREATSRRFLAELQAQTRSRCTAEGCDKFLVLPLRGENAELPLGWMLGPQSTKAMDARRRLLAEASHYLRLEALLGPKHESWP
jgi:hypothetical protein